MQMENQFWSLEYDVKSNRKDFDYKTFKNDIELYYDTNKKKWVKRAEYTGSYYPADFVCHSYRAARRHLQQHDEIPVGTRFRLVNRYVGFDQYLVKKG